MCELSTEPTELLLPNKTRGSSVYVYIKKGMVHKCCGYAQMLICAGEDYSHEVWVRHLSSEF